MRKIREILHLTHELGLSVREVSKATGVGKTSVHVEFAEPLARWSMPLLALPDAFPQPG